MTVFRVKKKERNFLVIDKTCLNDTKITFNARGLHAFLMGFKDDSIIKLEQLRRYTPQGRDALRTMLTELKEAGYITVEKIQDIKTGRYTGIEYSIHELPIISSQKKPEEKIPSTYPCPIFNPTSLEEIKNPRLENPWSENPSSDFPTIANPTEGKQGDNNINIINNKYYKTAAEEDLNEDSQNEQEGKKTAAVFSENVKNGNQGLHKIPNRLTPEDAVIHETLTVNQLARIEFVVKGIRAEAQIDEPNNLAEEIRYTLLSKTHFTACGLDFVRKLNAIRKVILRGDWQRPAGMVLEAEQRIHDLVKPIESELREELRSLEHFKKMYAVATTELNRSNFTKIIKASETKINLLQQKLIQRISEQKLR